MLRDRKKLDLIFGYRSDYLTVQEITPNVYETDRVLISILPMDFPPTTPAKFRKTVELKWANELPRLQHIRFLIVRHRVDQVFFEALCQMTNLEHLTIETGSLTDISSISNLKHLRRLEFDSCSKLTKIEPLLALEKLETLVIANCFKVSNFEIIGQMTNLVALAVLGDTSAPRNLRLESLKPFSNLKKLRHLDLTSTTINDNSYDTLLDMTSLERFDTSHTIKKPVRDKLLTHPTLSAGFFVDYDWDNQRLHDGKIW